MALRINDEIPDMTVETDTGTVSLHDWVGDSWAIIFSHPKDFTPVCTTEFGAVGQLTDEWKKRGVKVMGVSVDGVEDHKKWKGDIKQVSGADPDFPIVADIGLEISKAFDMLPVLIPHSYTSAIDAVVPLPVSSVPRYTSSHSTQAPASRAIVAISSSIGASISAPVGLFGVFSKMARVCGVRAASSAARSG